MILVKMKFKKKKNIDDKGNKSHLTVTEQKRDPNGIEKNLRSTYKESGKDDSLIYIQKYGYDFNNLNFKDIMDTN